MNKIEQMCVEAGAASNRNNTKKPFNIVKKLNGENSETSLSSLNKGNGEPPFSFFIKSPGNDYDVTAEVLNHEGDQLIEHFRQIIKMVFHS